MAYPFESFAYSSPVPITAPYFTPESSHDSGDDSVWSFGQHHMLPLPSPSFEQGSSLNGANFPSIPHGSALIRSHYEGSSYQVSPTFNSQELYPVPPPRNRSESDSWASSSHEYYRTNSEYYVHDDYHYHQNHTPIPHHRWENDTPCKPFAIKLDILLRNVDLYGDVVTWDASGRSFIVAQTDRLWQEVLPAIFSHSSLTAFTRTQPISPPFAPSFIQSNPNYIPAGQLTTYGFFHLSTSQIYATFQQEHISLPLSHVSVSAWSHPHFTRDDATTLHLLTPRPSRARSLHKRMKAQAMHGKVKGLAQGKAAAARKAAKGLAAESRDRQCHFETD